LSAASQLMFLHSTIDLKSSLNQSPWNLHISLWWGPVLKLLRKFLSPLLKIWHIDNISSSYKSKPKFEPENK